MGDVEKVQELCAKIGPILHGQGATIQGAVLADLLAMWLAGHISDDPAMRDAILQMHIDHVRKLVPVNEKLIGVMQPKNS